MSGVRAQTTPEVIVPKFSQGIVKLNILTISNDDKKSLGYKDLSVYVKNKNENYTSNAIQGRYFIEDDYLNFKPYFPFEGDLAYIVKTKKSNANNDYSYISFKIGQKKEFNEAKVVGIYPSVNELPENLLRLYIYFNTPMKKGEALQHIHLINEKGIIDNKAFMTFKQELWSKDGKRLTVLFDPGRIKKGVSTNTLLGPALIEGKQYQLNISSAWQDVYGQKLSVKTSKEIEIVSAYRSEISTEDWKIEKPKSKSYDALKISFDRLIDHALIASMIEVIDAEENLINGHWEVSENEQSAQFFPDKKWDAEKYQIVIDRRLEDVAGNNLFNLLDHNYTSDEEKHNSKYQYLDFKLDMY